MYLPQIAFLSAFEQLVEEIGLAQGARGAHINIYKSAGSSHVSLSHYGIKDKEQLFNTTYYYAPACLLALSASAVMTKTRQFVMSRPPNAYSNQLTL